MGDVVACVSSVPASCSCVGDVVVCATSPPDTRSAELEAEEEPEHPRAAHRHSVRMPVNTVRATLPPVRPFTLTACPSIRCVKDCNTTLTSPPRSESRVGRTTATLYILFSCLYQYICVAIKAGYVQSSTGRHSSLKGMPPNNRLKEHAPPHRTRRWIPQLARATRDDVRLLPIGRPDDDPLVACHGAQRSASS